jgi:hypothetical protein
LSWLQKVAVIAVCTAFLGCSPDEPVAWTPAQMSNLLEQYGHIAEAYAVVDLCMPMIESDRDSNHALTSMIGSRNYTRLLAMDTDAELERFFAYHKSLGGSAEQRANLEQAYRDAYQAAFPHLRALDTCVETVSDYANTILHTVVADN